MIDPEGEGSKFPRNVGKSLSDYMASHPIGYVLLFIGWGCVETKCRGHFDTGQMN
jgi:hypothetical protein